MKRVGNNHMKRTDVSLFEKLAAQLESIHSELTLLTKKSPNDAVNRFKLRFVNSTLEQCNNFFGEEYRPFHDFEKFYEDEMPSNSDVTFIVSQYIECGEKFRADNIKQVHDPWYLVIEGEDPNNPKVRTSAPKKINK